MAAPERTRGARVAGVHHVGIIVADLDAALAFLTRTLGLEVDRRASLPHESTELAFVRCGAVMLELIEISDPAARARRARIPGAIAEIEHVALEVEDLDATVAELAASGVVFTAGGGRIEATREPLEVARTRSLFTLRRTSAGILLQLIEDLAPADAGEQEGDL
jgi:catechol 2,3-dioxygenase-like lactoylglutathione lyase family enzyme